MSDEGHLVDRDALPANTEYVALGGPHERLATKPLNTRVWCPILLSYCTAPALLFCWVPLLLARSCVLNEIQAV